MAAKRGPKKGSRHAKHKYLYIDEKGLYVYEEARKKRGRPSKEQKRKEKTPQKKFIGTHELIKEKTGRTAEEWITENAGIGLHVANEFADKYNVLKFVDSSLLIPIESPNGKRVTTIAAQGVFGEIVQESLIGMWNGLKLWTEKAAEGKKNTIKITTAMYQGAEGNVKRTILPIIKGKGANVPLAILRRLNTLAQAEMELTMELGRLPESSELEDKTGFNATQIKKIRQARKIIYAKSTEQVEGGKKQDSGNKVLTVMDKIKDPRDVENQYIDQVFKRETSKVIKKELGKLDHWEREIITRHLGIGKDEIFIPGKVQEYKKEIPVIILATQIQKVKDDFIKQLEKKTGKKYKAKAKVYAQVLLPGGKRGFLPLQTIKDVRMRKDGRREGIHEARIIKKITEDKTKVKPRIPESFKQISLVTKIPVYSRRKVAKGEKLTFKKVSDVQIQRKYYEILEKLRKRRALKRIWEQMQDVDKKEMKKSFISEIIRMRYNLP